MRPILFGLILITGCDDAVKAPFAYDERPKNPTCVAPARPPMSTGEVRVERVFPNLRFNQPTTMAQAPGDNTAWYVTEQNGRVRKFPNDQAATMAMATNYVDISARVRCCGETGLLGMAFHPQFAANKKVYLSYTTPGPFAPTNMRSIVSRFLEKNGTLDPADEQIVFPADDSGTANMPGPTDQPYANHNGGGIAFGHDGMLYFGFGDGGSGGDPLNNGQKNDSLFGKMLRVDVDNIPAGQRYGIPDGNPFKGGGGNPAIFATGFRNPWRFSFDRGTGELWVGDVGQNAWEEIDLVRAGGNYGWRFREGAHCYNPMNNCPTAGLIDPVSEYSHNGGGASVVGGYVYRGKAMPGMVGVYFYADTITRDLFAIQYNSSGVAQHQVLLDTGVSVYSFAEDQDGELYITAGEGTLHKIVPMGNPVLDNFPKTLSATGCTAPGDAQKPAPGLIPYDVAAPLWSDGAEKRRWMAIPDGKQITLAADGDFDFPNGSVIVKEFRFGDRRVETRLFVRHDDGGWAGYTYEWNDAQTDATLLPAGKKSRVADHDWVFPSRSECLSCHTMAAGGTLGLEASQLNFEYRYDGAKRISNQLATLDHIDLVTPKLGDPATRPVLPRYDGPEPIAERARSYLHANCAICHRPMGPGQGMQDLRYTVTFRDTQLCNVDPQEGNLDVMGAKLVKPGDPSGSLVSLRMHALDANRMPPIATQLVDAQGTQLVDGWIASLTACP